MKHPLTATERARIAAAPTPAAAYAQLPDRPRTTVYAAWRRLHPASAPQQRRWTAAEWAIVMAAPTWQDAAAQLPHRTAATVQQRWYRSHVTGRHLHALAPGRRGGWTDTPAHRAIVARLLAGVRRTCRREGIRVTADTVQRILDALRSSSPSEWEEPGC